MSAYSKFMQGVLSVWSYLSAERAPGRWVFHAGAAIGIGLGVIAGGVYLVDPYLRYAKKPLVAPVYKDAYQMIPSLLDHGDYDSILAGTSMCMNFSLADAHRYLGWSKLIKTTAQGCHPATFKLFMERAFNHQSLRHVLSSVDLLWLDVPPGSHHSPIDTFLYEHSWKHECEYLLNRDIAFGAMYEVFRAHIRRDPRLNPDLMFGLNDVLGKAKYGESRITPQLLAFRRDKAVAVPDAAIEQRMLDNFSTGFVEVIRAHPETEFVLFFPPFPSPTLGLFLLQGRLELLLSVKRRIVSELQACPNVRVFDFQGESAYVNALDCYKDSVHFSPEVGRQLLEHIGKGRYVCSLATVDENAQKINLLARQAIMRYRPDLISNVK